MGEGERETAGHVLGTGLGAFRGLREGAGVSGPSGGGRCAGARAEADWAGAGFAGPGEEGKAGPAWEKGLGLSERSGPRDWV